MFVVILFFFSVYTFVDANCPSGFVTHESSCYHFSHDLETWLDALLGCEKLYGAYLAEIEDANENNFLLTEVNRLGTPFWIGGDDLRIEGEWRWATSGKPITYATWHPGNPSNSNGNENCMEILDGDGPGGPQQPLWNDKPCSSVQRYICEIETEAVQVVG